MAAPQGPCPLPGGARLTGIESRDDDPPPHGHAAWRGHAVRARRFRARRKRERVSATPIERHQKVVEAMSRGAEPAVGTCCLCGNGLPPMPELRHTSRTAPST